MASTPSDFSFHRGAPQEEALARLSYAVENGLRVAALAGAAGVGKSTLLAEFAREQRRAGAAVALTSGWQAPQVLWNLAAQWGLFPEREATEFALWRDVVDRLAQLRLEERSGVLLFDGFECETSALRFLRQLAACDPHPRSRLTIVIACDRETLREMPAGLRELIDLRVELEAWDRSDIEAAIGDCRLTPGGLEELQSLTAGVARQVTRLARFASLAATAEQLGSIDGETLLAVHDDLLVH
jgi:hypothetical protein